MNSHFLELRTDGFFTHEAYVPKNLLALCVVENLGGNFADSESFAQVGSFSHVEDQDRSLAFIVPFKLFQKRRHCLAGGAKGRSEIDHGDHAFYRDLRWDTLIGRNNAERAGKRCCSQKKKSDETCGTEFLYQVLSPRQRV